MMVAQKSALGRILFLTAFLGRVLQAEPSVYGFGTDEPESYASYSTPSTYSSAPSPSNTSIAALQSKITALEERIDGLTTIVEGLSASLNELQIKIAQPTTVEGGDTTNYALLKKLAQMIDEINANYVTKQELQGFSANKISTPKSTVKASSAVEIEQETTLDTADKTPATLYKEGVRHFVKHNYVEAKECFTQTDQQSYKPAASNYYLGEIAYYTKQYEDAIFYYKKSAGLYDQASYIDTLLLHTAISLDKSGDKEQAKIFYENIIANYAGKKTAQIAQQRLDKL